jgi:hypothetical protein
MLRHAHFDVKGGFETFAAFANFESLIGKADFGSQISRAKLRKGASVSL